MDIPLSPAELSPEWLTMALQHGRAIGACTVSGFECTPHEAQGLYGQISRLTLTYDRPGSEGPRTMIAKFSSSNPEMRQRPTTRTSYEREVRFYQKAADESPIPVPTCYYADVNTESGWHVLLLEDLAPARTCSRTEGCSPDQARTAIRHIARFHAYWWQNPKLDDLDWLSGASGAPDDDELARLHQMWWAAFLREAGVPLPGEIMEIGDVLGKHRGRITRHLFANEPRTMVHGDYGVGNLVFGPAGADSLSVVDWQFVGRGRGIWDVAYFLLSQNLAPEDRRTVEMDLLHDYLGILRGHGVRNYSFDDAMYDYRLSLLRRFGSLISTIAAMPIARESIGMHVEVLLPRIIAALLDHDCRSLLRSGSPLLP